jgi:hypothetical protein
LNDLVIAVIAVAAVPANAFPILYTFWKNWWRDEVSRHLVFLVVGLAALGDLALIRRTVGEFHWYDDAVVIVYAFVAYQLWRRMWLLVKYNSPWGEARELQLAEQASRIPPVTSREDLR